MADVDNPTWLQRTYYQETLKVYASVWDIYIKFYTVFLTANVVGLGLAVEHIAFGKRGPLVAAFVLQNVLTAATSLGVAAYSVEVDKKLKQLAVFLSASNAETTPVTEAAKGSPVPARLSRLAGYANCAGCVSLIFCWIAVNFLRE